MRPSPPNRCVYVLPDVYSALPPKNEICTLPGSETQPVTCSLSPDTSSEDPATQLLPRVTYPSPPSHPRAQTVPRSRVLDKRRPIPNAYSSPHTHPQCHVAPDDLPAPPVIGPSGNNPASAGKPSRRKSKRPRPPRHVVPHPFPAGPPPDLAPGPSDPREPTARIRLAPPQRPAPAYKYAPRARSPPARHSRIARTASLRFEFGSLRLACAEHSSGSPTSGSLARSGRFEKEKEKKDKQAARRRLDSSGEEAENKKKRIRRGATGRPPRSPRSVLLPRRSGSPARPRADAVPSRPDPGIGVPASSDPALPGQGSHPARSEFGVAFDFFLGLSSIGAGRCLIRARI